jgi:hypothetical protein
MGIYVQSSADLPANASALQLSASLKTCAARWAASRGLESLFFAGKATESGIPICFYPPGGSIDFKMADGRVSFDIKTSIGGPGFHAALIDLCYALQAELGLRWRWDDDADETGYALNRDLDALYREFEALFSGLCDTVASDPEVKTWVLNLAWGLARDGADGIATPMGILPAALFRDALADRPRNLAAGAACFFPWWQAGTDDAFWPRTLRAMLWADAEWRAPQTPWETYIHGAIFAVRQRLGATLEGDLRTAVLDLERAISSGAAPAAAAPADIGWRRRKREFMLPGPWRITLPGQYIEESEDDGSTICLWFGSEEIRGSSFTVTVTETGDFQWSKSLQHSVDQMTAHGESCVYRLPRVAEPLAEAIGGSQVIFLRAFRVPSAEAGQ